MEIIEMRNVDKTINEIINKCQNLPGIKGIYLLNYIDFKSVIEINLVFEQEAFEIVKDNYQKYFTIKIDDQFLDILIKVHRDLDFTKNSSINSFERFTAYKDILACDILYEEDNLLTNFKEYTLDLKKNNIYPFGTLPMEYNNLIEFKPPLKLSRKKVNNG